MKRIITLFLCVFYFVISLGVTCNVYYCKGKVHSIDFYASKKESCCGKGEMKPGCCKNVQLAFKKSKIEKENPSTGFVFNLQPVMLEKNLFQVGENYTGLLDSQLVEIYPPPEETNFPPLHLLHCVFII